MKSGNSSVVSVSVVSFFTALLILTLNAENGRDILDVTVEYIAATTDKLERE